MNNFFFSRQCYFGNERQLKYFKTYTQRNCEMECVSDYIQKQCGCTRFSMPSKLNHKEDFRRIIHYIYLILGTNSTPICGASNIFCYHKAEDDLLNNNIRDNLSGTVSEDSSHCNCLPVCTSIKYDTEVSHSDFDFKSLFEAYETPLEEYKE